MIAWLDRAASSGWKLPVLSGLLMVGAYYAPLPFLPFVFFLPLLFKLERGGAPIRNAFLCGMVAYTLGLHYWIVPTIEMTWLAVVLWVLLAVLFSVRFSLSWWLLARLRRQLGWSYALLLPLVWLPLEFVQGLVPDLRMTADHVAHMLARFPFLIQFADVVGHYGVGLFLLSVSGGLYDLAFGPATQRRRAAAVLAVWLVVVPAYDAWAWQREWPEVGRTRVSIVQPNIALEDKRGSAELDAAQDAQLHRLTREAARERPDLIVWPETARPRPLDHWIEHPQTFAMKEVQALAQEVDASILTGVYYRRIRSPDDYDRFNAAVAVASDGSLNPAWAAKIYLVPFVEATPFRSIFGSFVEGRDGYWEWLAGTFEPGPRDVVIETGGAKVGVWICYEELFPELSRRLRNAGAEFQVLITNDAWWGRTAFQRYLADVLRLRAIENRTDIVRVANTGISGFVDLRGRYHQQTELFEAALETRTVARTQRSTLYSRIGDVVAWLAVLGLVGALVTGRRRSRVIPSE